MTTAPTECRAQQQASRLAGGSGGMGSAGCGGVGGPALQLGPPPLPSVVQAWNCLFLSRLSWVLGPFWVCLGPWGVFCPHLLTRPGLPPTRRVRQGRPCLCNTQSSSHSPVPTALPAGGGAESASGCPAKGSQPGRRCLSMGGGGACGGPGVSPEGQQQGRRLPAVSCSPVGGHFRLRGHERWGWGERRAEVGGRGTRARPQGLGRGQKTQEGSAEGRGGR